MNFEVNGRRNSSRGLDETKIKKTVIHRGDELAEAVAEQPWDPSIQSMAAVPEALERLANDIQWTTELGNAFLAQQSNVMDAGQLPFRKLPELRRACVVENKLKGAG